MDTTSLPERCSSRTSDSPGRKWALSMQHVLAIRRDRRCRDKASVTRHPRLPVLVGFPPATTIFFAGLGTIIFILATRHRVPSSTASSFRFIAPVVAAKALGGISVTGGVLLLIGLLIDPIGYGFVDRLLRPRRDGRDRRPDRAQPPPPGHQGQLRRTADDGPDTLVAILLIGVVFKGFIGRMSVFLGVLIGYLFAAIKGDVDFAAVYDAGWIGLPELTTPTFSAARSCSSFPP